MRKGGVTGGTSLPPPFYGPHPHHQDTIYYHHGYPITPTSSSKSSSKKSLAEKIGKRLDRLAATASNQLTNQNNNQKTSAHVPPSVAATAAWVYPVYHPHQHTPRVVPVHAHTSAGFVNPWEPYYADYVEFAYEYPVASPPATASPIPTPLPSGSGSGSGYCGCYDNLHGTVSKASRRSAQGSKCKHCHKSRGPLNYESTLKKLSEVGSNNKRDGGSVSKSKSNAFKEYLEFNGINRLNKKIVGTHLEDEWHSYWDKAEHSNSTSSRDNSKDNKNGHGDDDSFTNHLKVSENKTLSKDDITVVKGNESESASLASTKRNLTTFAAIKSTKTNKDSTTASSSCEENNYSATASIQDKKSAAELTKRGGGEGDTGDVDNSLILHSGPGFGSQSESDSHVAGGGDEKKNIAAKESDSNEEKEEDSLNDRREIDSSSSKSKSAASALLLQDELKSRLAEELVKQRLARRYHRKYRKPSSIVIDEVILEEDEDALEAENLEVISEDPVTPVKSILKRSSTSSDSSDNNDTSSSPRSSDNENLSPSEESNDSNSDSEKNNSDDKNNGNMLASMSRHKSGGNKRKKGVTFSANPVATISRPEIVFHEVGNGSSTSASEEELFKGYDKIVVSNNLAEEILDEIYGKTTGPPKKSEEPPTRPATAAKSAEVSEANNGPRAFKLDDSNEYENANMSESGAIEKPFRLHPEPPPVSPQQPRSLADEILDELYGGKNGSGRVKAAPSSLTATAKPVMNEAESKISLVAADKNEEDSCYETIESRSRPPPTLLPIDRTNEGEKLSSKPDLASAHSPAIAELAKRFRKQKQPKKAASKSLRSSKSRPRPNSMHESSSMSSLFNDTTRLRLQSRPSLSNMFYKEDPAGSQAASCITRPKDPPPPPPPVAPVLLPVTPPRKFFPFFTNDELERINSVINGNEVASNGKCDKIIEEGIENEDTIDEFSSDEFSEDEFDQATYENLATSELKPRTSPDGSESNYYDNVPEIIEEDSLEEKMSFAAEYGTSADESELDPGIPPPLPLSPPPIEDDESPDSQTEIPTKVNVKELVEKSSEKTIIFNPCASQSKQEVIDNTAAVSSDKNSDENNDSHKVKRNSVVSTNDQILISSSSWIDLQGASKANIPNGGSSFDGLVKSNDDQEGEEEAKCTFQGPISVKDDLIFQRPPYLSLDHNTLDSLEPVKPPRLKKMAKLQKLQQGVEQQPIQTQKSEDINLKRQTNRDQLERHLKERMRKISNLDKRQAVMQHASIPHSSSATALGALARPDISSPILMATTLNPNDQDGHRSLSHFSSSDVQELLNRQHRDRQQHKQQQRSSRMLSPGDKITFKDLKRYATTSFASLSGNFNRFQHSVGRSSFYQADASQDSIYEDASKMTRSVSSPTYSEHIYEEIPDRKADQLSASKDRPLPPIPADGSSGGPSVIKNGDRPKDESDKQSNGEKKRNGSIFEGASKYEILHYLKDAKDRIGHGDFEIDLDNSSDILEPAGSGMEVSIYHNSGFAGMKRHANHRVSAISNLSDSSSCSVESNDSSGSGVNVHKRFSCIPDIERTDSGVGSETSKSSKASVELRRAPSLSKSSDSGSGSGGDIITDNLNCQDCDQELSDGSDCGSANMSVVCKRCAKRRSERKEIITEIAETEAKYGRDLRIVVEEFYRPMLVAGLLTSDQLAAIFLNVDELMQVNSRFTELLRDAIEIAFDSGDEDLATVNVGKLFLDSLSMLRAFESYCTRQASASVLLTTLEKERELLRIFLKVSQMENSMLRRMNLSSFLMVPVQRVTKYPLLLNRLYKVTNTQHNDRNDIKLAQERIEAALDQMNKDAKDVVNSSKLWKRLQPIMTSSTNSSPSKKADSSSGGQDELSVIKLQKLALETLGWSQDETQFPLEGKIMFTQPAEANWRKVWTAKLSPVQGLLCVLSTESLPEVTGNKELIFPPESTAIKDASLIIVREKNARYSLVRDPLPLENCVVCCEQDWDDCFEIQEFVNKEQFVFKGEEPEDTMMWFKTLQFYTQCLGGWRKRRKGLANIMIDPNVVNAAAASASGPDEQPDEGASALPTE